MQQSLVILDLCLKNTRSGRSRDHRDAIVFEKLLFQNVLRSCENKKLAFSNSTHLMSVFVNGGPNFTNDSGVEWTRLYFVVIYLTMKVLIELTIIMPLMRGNLNQILKTLASWVSNILEMFS